MAASLFVFLGFLFSLWQVEVLARKGVKGEASSKEFNKRVVFFSVLGIRDILGADLDPLIRIRGYVPLTNGSGSHSFNLPAGTLSSIFNLLLLQLKFVLKILICKHYFGPLNTLMRKKGKDPDPEPYL
jgi:hypothetical protein